LLTAVRITHAAAGADSTSADEPFFRAVEPQRRGGHTDAASSVRLKPDTTYD
jgi:hypothetical protein